jgi:anthrone oxygenase-like protein
MRAALQSVTVASTALFALWALYVSLVEHPSRMGITPSAGRAQFRESYRRAAPWQAGAAAVALLSGAATSIVSGEWAWAIAGVAVGAAIPFTLLAIMPTNDRLRHGNPSDSETRSLLVRWGRLHLVRSLLGLAALAILCSRVAVQ